MHVLMTIEPQGGVWTYALELAHALAPRGVDVSFAILGGRLRRDQRTELRRVPIATLHESNFRLEWMDEPWDDVAASAEWLLGLEAQLHPDIVHLNSFVHASSPWAAPVVVVAHAELVTRWAALHGAEPLPREAEHYRRGVELGLLSAKMVVAPSVAMLDALHAAYPFKTPTLVIPHGRRDERLRPGLKETVVLAAGRFDEEARNLEAVVRVAPRLGWPVVIAGDGDPSVDDDVRWLGWLPWATFARWLGRASIHVSPARYEPFGLGTLEAALAGCALVVGDIPSMREVWRDAALYVDPLDDEAMVGAIQSLIDDDEQRRTFAERARERAFVFSPARMADGYVGAYRRVTSPEEPDAEAEAALAYPGS